MNNKIEKIINLLTQILPEDLEDLEDLDPLHRRRLEIAIRSNMGQSQSEICSALGCSKEMARYWMKVGKTGELNNIYLDPVGRPKRINQEYLNRLKELVTSNPKDEGYSFKRWTGEWLSKQLFKEFGIEISSRHINRLLKQMGLSTRDVQNKKLGKLEEYQDNKISLKIEDLNPSLLSQSDDSLWSFYKKN